MVAGYSGGNPANEKYAVLEREAFDQDELIQTWIVRHLQVIGEAARALPTNLREQHPEVPWSKILGMRNALVHDYFGIDREVVWSVIQCELPDLKTKIEAIIRALD